MARLMIMLSFMIAELAGGIAAILGVCSQYPYRVDEAGIAGCVCIVAGILVCCMITIAYFTRSASRNKVRRIMDEAKAEAARIVSEAADKAMALCSLDAGKSRQCGNPRTGRFCPKCGAAAQSA
jgi:hypothetical protein